MIRWYDYILAVVFADVMLSFAISGFVAEGVFQSLLSGLVVGLAWSVWSQDYCEYRRNKEREKR
jgi:hypothetical protein